jgi:hypothetical protein
MPDSLTFSIQPDAETVSLNLFAKSVEDIRKLVRDVDYAVTRQHKGRRWIISRLHSTLPTMTIKSVVNGADTVEAIATGLRIVATGISVEPPPHFSGDALDDLISMRRLFKGRDRAQRIICSSDGTEVASIDKGTAPKVERILRGTYTVLGSLEGTLDAINVHGPGTFTIWDRLSGHPVRCTFPKEPSWVQRVKDLLQTRVLVSGEVAYFSNGAPRSITHVREIRDMTPDPSLPRAGFGSIPDLAGGKEPAEYLRSMRE